VRPLLVLLALITPALAAEPSLALVETAPVETPLDHADIPEAYEVWPKLIDEAKKSVDLAEFYATTQPGSRLEPTLAALERAVQRGVKVRMLVDAGFAKKEPGTVERLEKVLTLRRIDWHARAGGVLHAKYFVVDGAVAYLGSQNFDWRSLTHIQELGVRARASAIAAALEDVFETDWALAGGGPSAARVHHEVPQQLLDGAQVIPVYSPKGWLPDEKRWDLPRLVELIDGAKKSVRVQLLTYSPARGFDDLDAALRRAGARGVEVELLVSDWCKRKGCIEGLQRLVGAPHVAVKLISVPEASTGFVPYARVAHAKYLVVDGAHAWVGTSNWERDYFYASRNVGLIINGGPIPPRLDIFFDGNWQSSYAEPVDPKKSYTPPRTH
jgi:phosphatidylserine/phosphatidylglycerophosphate/cardiolipin synthase-like enzyme